MTQLPEWIKGEIRAEAPDGISAQVTALTKQLDEKVGAISRQLMEKGVVTKQLRAREEDCDLLRAAGAWLQARIAQLEAKPDMEIEQLNDELAGLEAAGSSMRSVGCGIRETPGDQHEGVAKIRRAAQHAQRNLRPCCWQQRGCDVDGDRRLQQRCSAVR